MNLVESLRAAALTQPRKVAFRSLNSRLETQGEVTYLDLAAQVAALAADLRRQGLAGRRIAQLQSDPLEFLTTFLAGLSIGATSVPLNPRLGLQPRSGLEGILRDAKVSAVFADANLYARRDRDPALSDVRLSTALANASAVCAKGAERVTDLEPGPGADATAVIQYTSGSTSAPKGVRITHGNFIANANLLTRTFRATSAEQVVSWLPLFHDMGLMTGIVWPLVAGASSVLMAPSVFSARPVAWLEALSKFGATVSSAPNFAFQACAERVPAEEAARLDLRRWRIAICGAEPIRPEGLAAFAAAMAPAGFDAASLFPSYGLAEATLFVSGGRPQGGSPGTALAGAPPRPVACCGRIGDDLQVEIVDPTTRTPLEDGQTGEVWVRGPSVSPGYLHPPPQDDPFDARMFGGAPDGFLRTGDLGFKRDGDLYITGRMKDLLIVRGVKYWPQDIEHTAQAADPALAGCRGAAFDFAGAADEMAQVVLVQECDRSGVARLAEIGAAIRGEVARTHGLALAEVLLVRRRSLPLTSSGKVRRHPTREAFRTGALAALRQADLIPRPEHVT
jgi:acyl-CoA synthetase (AMP-forming)/AMP-acid ligase II